MLTRRYLNNFFLGSAMTKRVWHCPRLVDLYDIIAHHLSVTDFPQWSEDFADVINIFNTTCHVSKLLIILEVAKEKVKVVVFERSALTDFMTFDK